MSRFDRISILVMGVLAPALWVAVAMTVVSGIDLVANRTRASAAPPTARHPVES